MGDDGQADLFVTAGERPRARFRPGDSPVWFGRASRADIPICPNRDTSVARWAGALRFDEGLWYVRNESDSRPFHVVVHGESYPLHAVRPDGTVAVWTIAPPGLDLRFPTPTRPLEMGVRTARPAPGPTPDPDEDPDGPSTPRVRLRDHDRHLISAKFLAEGAHGPVLGDKAAAELATERLGPDAKPVTPAAVMSAVVRARDLLVGHGVEDVDGAQNIRNLRRELFAWGYLAEQDGRWLHPPRP